MDRDTLECLKIATVVAVPAHFFVRKYGLACLITALASPILCIAGSFGILHMSPAKLAWLPMVYTFLAVFSLVPAVLVGVVFWAWRRIFRRRAGQVR